MSLRQGRDTRLCADSYNDTAICQQLSFFQEFGEDNCVCKRLHSVHAVDGLTGGEENVSRLLLEFPVSDMEFICSWLLY